MKSSQHAQAAATGENPSPLCPKCRSRSRHQTTTTLRTYCSECDAVEQRERRYRQKIVPRLCELCGEPLPHKKGRCPTVFRQTLIRRGRTKLNERWPGYGDALTDEHWLESIGHNWPRCAYPVPSFVFAGLDPTLDARLIAADRDKDVIFCRTLASVPSADQRAYLELALVDPIDAAKWLSLPSYQRPIRKGDRDDDAIWRFFTMQRLNMNLAAEGRAWELKSQGAQLPQMFGMIDRLSMAGVKKLVLVMNAYGYALQAGKPLGNVTKKPWE
jgi:hypothetical protein